MKAISLLNHKLTDKQIDELKTHTEFGVSEVIELTQINDEAKKEWGNINPWTDDSVVQASHIYWTYVAPIIEEGDILIVQGEAGAVFTIVQIAFSQKLIPVFATTQRVSKEVEVDGVVTKTNVFEHCRFKYFDSTVSY